MRRLVIAAALGTAVVGTAVPSLASTTSTPKATLPVGATVSTNGGVFVGTTIFGQPGLSAAVANGRVCVGFSLEVPFCADTPPVTVTPIPHSITAGGATVTVNTDNGGVSVGSSLGSQPLVGAGVGNGKACVGFSEEIPFCLPLTQSGRTAAPSASRQSLPVVFYHDDTRTAVGVGEVGVIIYADGEICPVVSTQDWRCIPAQLG